MAGYAIFHVRDSYTQQPLPEALIIIGGQQQETDIEGNTTFTLNAGPYTYTISKEGYRTYYGELSIMEGSAGEHSIGIMPGSEPPPPPPPNKAQLQLEILDSQTGSPVSDVKVTLGTITVYTDNLGWAYLEVDPGSYILTAEKTGYNTSMTQVSLTAGIHTWSLALVPGTLPPPPYTEIIVDIVVYKKGTSPPEPIAGASVTVNGVNVGNTDINGILEVVGPPGVYNVEVAAAGFKSASTSSTLDEYNMYWRITVELEVAGAFDLNTLLFGGIIVGGLILLSKGGIEGNG